MGEGAVIGRNIAMVFLFVLIVGFGATQCSQKGRAQDGHHGIGHAQLHDAYRDWRRPDNPAVSCCHNEDCRPTRAYVGEDGLWRAWNGFEWLIVLPGATLPTDYAGDGRSHICERSGYLYCFSPGPPKS